MTGPSRGPTTAARKVACWLVLLAILLAGAEGLSFAFAKLRPGLFSQRDKVVAALRKELDRYPEFLARAYDPALGWDNVPGEHRIQACDGRPVTVTILPDRSRRPPAVEGGPEVLLVGDSYTYGDEVGDEETFAWRLSERLGVAVVNHGVQGYSPVQAMLKLERVADAHPRARVAVLAITHVDLARMVSRYRPLVDPRGGQDFGFEPYMDGDRLVPNPNGPTPVPAEQLPELARAAFAEDWHALPEARLPYSLRVAQLLAGHSLRVLGTPESFGDLLQHGILPSDQGTDLPPERDSRERNRLRQPIGAFARRGRPWSRGAGSRRTGCGRSSGCWRGPAWPWCRG